MQDKYKFFRALTFLLLLHVKMPLHVQAATVSGTELFVVDCTNQTLTLRFLTEKVPQAARTNNIRKEASSATAVAWSILWQAPQPTLPAIKEYQALGSVSGACPAVGSYVVPITLVFDDRTHETLEIHIVRFAEPILELPSSITLTTKLPVRNGLPYVSPIRLRETSGAGTIEGISGSGGQLKNAAGEVVETVLNLDFRPPVIRAGQSTDLRLRVSDTPALGIYTTRLMVHSPSLKQSHAIDVTFKVILLPFYLAITILFGVVIGWLVNVWLAGRAALNTARIEAYRIAGSLGRRATLQKDPAVQQRIIALVATLEFEIRSAKNPEELHASLTKIASDAEAIEHEAGKASEVLRQSLMSAHEILEPGHIAPDMMIFQKLEALIRELENISTAAETGDVTNAQRSIDEFLSKIVSSIAAALQPWLQAVYGRLYELGEWSVPALALELERKRILELVESTYQASGGHLISECDKIGAALRTLMVFTGPRLIADAFRVAAISLQATKPFLATSLSSLAADLLKHAASGASPMDILSRLISTRNDAEMQLQREKPGDSALLRCLEIGDFPAAATIISPPIVVTAAVLSPLPTLITRNAPVLAYFGNVDPIMARILIPPLLPLLRPSDVILDLPGSQPFPSITWTCELATSAYIEAHKDDARKATIIPRSAGFLTVSAAISGRETVRAKTFAGTLTETIDFKQLVKNASWVNYIIWTTTAIITSAVGYLIFIDAWVGTFADFFSAFAWGFFGQFSLDRMREAVKTTVARVLPG